MWLVLVESWALGYRTRAEAEHAREALSAFPRVEIIKIKPVERDGFIKHGDHWFTWA